MSPTNALLATRWFPGVKPVTVWSPDGFPATYVFRTREKTKGIFQIVDSANELGTVRILYKLLRPPPGAEPEESGPKPGEPAEPVGVSLRSNEDASHSDEPPLRMPLPVSQPDPVGTAQMVQAFKGQFFSAYTALIEKDDPETALVVMQLMISQTDDFQAKLKDTPAEHAVAGGIAQLRLAITALEEGKIERAKMLLEGLNSMGAEFEKMINQTAAGAID